MQLEPFAKDPPYLIGLAGRPGTPVPTALRGMIRSAKGGLTWSSSGGDESVEVTPEDSVYYKLPDTVVNLPSTEKRLDVPRVNFISTDLSLLGDANMDLTPTSRREDKGKDRAFPTSTAITPRRPSSKSRRHRSSTDPGSIIKKHVKELSRAEVHLLFNLGKKLEWLCGELEPYRRPAQFLLIFNHWLNKKTWYVYDAPGRVPLPKRVEVDLERKRRRKRIVSSETHKQQQQHQEPASASPTTAVCGHRSTRNSRLESWRTAVNIARRCSGTETFDKEIDQILKCSEPPPDGAMDPASWIIRRPPQGNNSLPRGDTWFEGSGGVLETYENWQRAGKFRCARMKRYLSNGLLFGSNSTLAATGINRGGLVEGENRKPKRRDGSSGRMVETFHGIRKISQSRFKRIPSGAFRRRRNPSNVVGDRCSTERTGGKTLVASRDISISALLGRSGNSGGCRTVDETNENHVH
ncbi:hypothetical protein KEM56_003543 [Ascosphaera pollenicola]|nr:hypothetical protein KEM56_003543 [Ascosphaera pollenicola]